MRDRYVMCPVAELLNIAAHAYQDVHVFFGPCAHSKGAEELIPSIY